METTKIILKSTDDCLNLVGKIVTFKYHGSLRYGKVIEFDQTDRSFMISPTNQLETNILMVVGRTWSGWKCLENQLN